jgi:NADH:ubiquinone oxidoreductase subunit 5 (subunit L)/multisubunit Na+/H+ antiporter MnhA subunit
VKPKYDIIKILIITILTSAVLTISSILQTRKTLKMNLSSEKEWLMQIYFKIRESATPFLLTVATVSTAVTMFSIAYINEEKKKKEFNTIMALFIARIILIVLSPNATSIMLGWDGLGISSILLVIHYQNQIRLASGIITVLRNRIGDLAIIWIIASTKEIVWTNCQRASWSKLLILTAAITKRAQVPFSAWLPAAIAAPTPTSALVHSSTLVTAGIWLINQFNTVLKMEIVKKALILTAVLTTILAGVTAKKEKDIKKIVAISTLSQLGMIIILTSIGIKTVALLHINTHALFKALLFMSVGSAIRKTEGSQKEKRLSSQESKTSSTAIKTALITLMRIPITSRFFSKDLMIELIISKGRTIRTLAMLTTAVLTISYSIKIARVIAKKKKSSERTEIKFKKGEAALSVSITLTSVYLTTTADTNIVMLRTSEKIIWVVLLISAIIKRNKNEKGIRKEEKIMIIPVITTKSTSRKKKKTAITDKIMNNKIIMIITKVIEIREKKKNLKKALVVFLIVTIVTIE